MKSVMMSIKPKYCELIASSKKTVEVRKTRPKIETPFKCYIYCTLPPKEELLNFGSFREYANELIRLQDGLIVYDYGMRVCCDIEGRPYSQDNFLCKKVIGEFVCDCIDEIDVVDNAIMTYIQVNKKPDMFIASETCLNVDELQKYLNNKIGYGWHISDLVIYDKPKELEAFTTFCYANKKRCANCKHYLFDNDDLNGYRRWCGVYHRKPLTRPPQSWCYVEGRKDR